jgi:hypothetical protein
MTLGQLKEMYGEALVEKKPGGSLYTLPSEHIAGIPFGITLIIPGATQTLASVKLGYKKLDVQSAAGQNKIDNFRATLIGRYGNPVRSAWNKPEAVYSDDGWVEFRSGEDFWITKDSAISLNYILRDGLSIKNGPDISEILILTYKASDLDKL